MGGPEPHILSIDLGTTNLKAALFDIRLNRLAETAVAAPLPTEDRNRIEFDPEDFWNRMVKLITSCCEEGSVGTDQIGRIALGSQAQTFTFLDPDGQASIPFISWLDGRGTDEAADINRKLESGIHSHSSFSGASPLSASSKVFWVLRRNPEIAGPGVSLVFLPTFVAVKLGGVFVIDENLAAMSGLYSLREGTWWSDALDLCGLAAVRMPEVIEVGGARRIDKPCRELDLADDLEIVFAGNDQTAGAYGNRASDLILTLGTALVAYRRTGSERGPYHPESCWGPYPGGGYYELATRDWGCAALDWACQALLKKNDLEEFNRIALAGRRREKDVYFFPERLGADNAWIDGKGGPPSGDLSEKALAVLEGISFAVKELVLSLYPAKSGGGAPEASAAPTNVYVIGGGARSQVLRQLLSDILNLPLRRGTGDGLLGAALMASNSKTEGMETDFSEKSNTPNPEETAKYSREYRKWLSLGGAKSRVKE